MGWTDGLIVDRSRLVHGHGSCALRAGFCSAPRAPRARVRGCHRQGCQPRDCAGIPPIVSRIARGLR